MQCFSTIEIKCWQPPEQICVPLKPYLIGSCDLWVMQMTAVLVIARMLTERERERESRDPFPAHSLWACLHLVTSCVFSGWTGCYLIIVKRLVLRIRNALETDLNLTAQTTHSRRNWTSLDASACWNHICTFYSSQNVTKQMCENMLYAIWHVIVRYDSAKAGAQIWGMQYMQCIGASLCQNKSLKIFFNKAFKIFEKWHL